MQMLYIYDALCGWCYGFSPVIQQFRHRYRDELSFEVISGGMVTGERVGPVGKVADYINQAYPDVENTTGVKFGQGFLQGILAEGTTTFSSVPPALALSVFVQQKPAQAVSFASRLQKAIYDEGIEPTNFSAYGPLAAEYGLDPLSFVDHMHEPRFQEIAERDFQFAQALGVNSFPTMILIFGEAGAEKAVNLSQGYVPLERLENQYLKAKQMIAAGQL